MPEVLENSRVYRSQLCRCHNISVLDEGRQFMHHEVEEVYLKVWHFYALERKAEG